VETAVSRQAPLGRPVRLFFQDEARFGRINDPQRCWAPRRLRPAVGRQIVREYSYAFAAVSPHEGTLFSLVLPEVHTDAMSFFLAELARQHPSEYLLLVLDGAGWHRSHDLEIPENVELLALPPYSPELNPVEHLWEEIREKWFTNLVFDSQQAVEDLLVEALSALHGDPERTQSLTGFEWIVNIPMNAD
jgi:transposase